RRTPRKPGRSSGSSCWPGQRRWPGCSRRPRRRWRPAYPQRSRQCAWSRRGPGTGRSSCRRSQPSCGSHPRPW
ncbi:Tranposon-transfer assisting protein, partial [Dysosmobacter welbionis]